MLHNFISTLSEEDLYTKNQTLAVLDFSNSSSRARENNSLAIKESESNATPSFNEHWEFDSGVISKGENENCNWRSSEQFQFTKISHAFTPSKSYEQTTQDLYSELLEVIHQSPHKNLVRFWNHIPLINQGEGDQENYKLFCNGRLSAFQDHNIDPSQYPAATVIGHQKKTIVVTALTSNNWPMHQANPRQVDAFHYPRQYGPSSPTFARATTIKTAKQELCFISGTASILGHNTVHKNDLALQLYTTSDNILYLLKETGFSRDSIRTMRVYLKNWEQFDESVAIVEKLYPDASIIYTLADLCRKDLLVEIECFCSD